MRRIWSLAVVVAAACHSKAGGGSDECVIVSGDPTHAMARLSDTHKDPADAAEVIEKCLAPTGDDCARLQKILPALPAIMNMPGRFQLPDAAHLGEVCKGMPPEMRRCMFASYTLRHIDECAKVNDKIREAVMGPIAITPSTVPTPCDKPPVEVTIGRKGVGVGSAYHEGVIDPAWLEATLKPYVAGGCSPQVVVSAEEVRYQDMVTAMDTAVKVGLPDVVLGEQGPGPRHGGSGDMASAPVVIVTRTDITLGGVSYGAPGKPETILALAKALPAAGGMAIVQADQDTDARVINRLVEMLGAQGYDNVMFAVKKP